MWRKFRFYLKKDFPTFEFIFKKVENNIYEILIRSRIKPDITLRLGYDSKNKDKDLFDSMYNSLKQQIKTHLFVPKKRKSSIRKS
jgi:hypothetical protein